MDEKEFQALVDRVGEEAAKKIRAEVDAANKKLSDELEALKKSSLSKEQIEEATKTAVEEAVQKANDAFKSILEKQGEAIKTLQIELKSHNENGKPMTVKQALKAAFSSEETISALKDAIKDQKVAVKVAVTMGDGNTIGSGSTQVTLTQNTGIISPIRRRMEKYLGLVSVGSIAGERALWVEETDEQGIPVFIAEAAGKIQLSSIWVEKTQPVKKIGVYGKVTTELMADLPQLLSYIEASLLKRLNVKVEDELVNGLGTGNTLKGAVTWATAFDGGGLTTETPNDFDVLRAIALQAEVANGEANGVMINPVKWANMQTLKDEQGRPIWKDYVIPGSGGQINFAGMDIVTSTAIGEDEFVGGDMSVLQVRIREELSIQIGLDGNDFTNNVKTILAEKRLVQFVSANDAPCLITGDFASARTTITATP